MQVWIAAALFLSALALWKPMTRDRGRLRAALVFLALWAAALATELWPAALIPAGEAAYAFLALAAVQILAVLLFDLFLQQVHLPKFASEMLIVASYVSILFHLLYKLGVNVTGIFATSAVATAVVGLALQDMLGNIAGGIALELEGGIRPGDYLRCGEGAGWVQHVRLRHTSMITPNGEVLILPNSHLTRSPVHIETRPHRLFVPFVMPYATNPQALVEAVESALRSSPLRKIVADPAPRCIIQEMAPGHVRYAAEIWTDSPGHDSDITSTVLMRVYFALNRAGIPAGGISYLLEMKESKDNAASAPLNPVEVLRRTPILRLLDDADITHLAAHLHHLSFAPGEYIIRQDEAGSSMYFIASGRVAIRFRSAEGSERVLSSMEAGDFFGEAGLLTGERRSATAVAQTRVDCYRLDKGALSELMGRRVELAEDMSVVIAHRQMELIAAREELDVETARRREEESQTQMLARIRKFFGISASEARA